MGLAQQYKGHWSEGPDLVQFERYNLAVRYAFTRYLSLERVASECPPAGIQNGLLILPREGRKQIPVSPI